MNTHNEEKFFDAIEDTIKKARGNNACLFPNCNRKPTGSHIIARRTLKDIADNKLQVLTWSTRNINTFQMSKSLKAGQPLEKLFEEPIPVNITAKNRMKYPIFCEYHDNNVFAPLENRGFSFQPEQLVLLAFRAFCSMIFSLLEIEAILSAVVNQHSFQRSLGTQEDLLKLQRFQATEVFLQGRQRYEQILSSKYYDQLECLPYQVNIQPSIAATNSLFPAVDATAIINGAQGLTVEDAVSFSFLPYKSMNNSICVISFLRGSQGAQRFKALYKIDELTENEQQDLFLTFAFESPTIYISPTWWYSLSEEKREEYKKIHLDVYRRQEGF
jgi:hypothetical protein